MKGFYKILAVAAAIALTFAACKLPVTPDPAIIAVSAGTSAVASGAAVTGNGAVVGTPTTTTFTIANTGGSNLTGVAVSVSGTNAAEFTVSSAPTATIAAAASSNFTITFSPAAAGTRTATVAIANSIGAFSFILSAEASAAPEANVVVTFNTVAAASGSTATFGNVLVAGILTGTVALNNTGTADLTVGVSLATGTNFAVTTAPAASVAIGAATSLVVTFTAPATAGTYTDVLTIATNDPDTPSYTLSLSAIADAPVSNIAVAFGGSAIVTGGTVAIGDNVVNSAATLTFTVSNSGTGVLAVSGATFSGTNASEFAVATAVATPVALAGSAPLVVSFTPTSAGAKVAVLTIASDDPDTPNYVVNLTANGTAANDAWFVKQSLADTTDTTTAVLYSGAITVHNNYSSTGNAFYYTAGTPPAFTNNFNGLIALPLKFGGDFSANAEITVTAMNKVSNASGIGVGMFTGFANTDSYGFMLARNASATTGTNFYCFYTKGTSVGTSGSGSVSNQAINTSYTLSFRRAGASMYWTVYPTSGSVGTESSAGVSNFIGCTGDVYAGISFANVNAVINRLVIKGPAGNVLLDSAAAGFTLSPKVPASLMVSASALDLTLGGANGTVTATATAFGGGAAAYSLSGFDSGIITATASGNTITIAPVAAGNTTITVANDSDTVVGTRTKTINVTVNAYSTSDNYGTIPATRTYPAIGAAAAYTDGEIAITFDSAPTLNTGGSIRIHQKADGALVDTIKFAGESQYVWSTTVNVADQLVRLDAAANTLYITPHFGKLAYNTAYYVVIPTAAITGTFNGVVFAGFSDRSTVATWNFTTKAAPTLSASDVTVDGAQNSTKNFRTVQAALSYLDTAFGTGTTAPVDVAINVAAGTYRELVYYKGGHNITIAGPAGNTKGDSCVITYRNGNSLNGGTHTRASFYISNSNLVLKNVTLKNTAVRATLAQAETIYFANGVGKTMAAYNCSFSSYQDTIQTSGRNWFYNCYIEGNVDFIWGTADAALFENCSLKMLYDGTTTGYSIFVARTGTTGAATVGKGYVLLNSTVDVGDCLAYYGRNAGAGSYYDQVALINVAISKTGTGSLGTGLWNVGTAPTKLGDASYVGWKAAGCTGLSADTITPATGTSAVIASQSTEYDTRDHILNRVVTVNGTTYGYDNAATSWNLSALQTAFGL